MGSHETPSSRRTDPGLLPLSDRPAPYGGIVDMDPLIVVLVGVLASVFMAWVAYVSKKLVENAHQSGVTTTILTSLVTTVNDNSSRLTAVEDSAAKAQLAAAQARGDALAEALAVRDRLEREARRVRTRLEGDAAVVKDALDQQTDDRKDGGARVLVLTVVSMALVLMLLLGALWMRADGEAQDKAAAQREQAAICQTTQSNWDTLHGLIEELGKPGPQGNAIDNIKIPPGTDPTVIAILAQLTSSANPADPRDLDRFYKVLGPKPACQADR